MQNHKTIIIVSIVVFILMALTMIMAQIAVTYDSQAPVPARKERIH